MESSMHKVSILELGMPYLCNFKKVSCKNKNP